MGCTGSKSVVISPGKQLYLYLSDEETKLVQESWEVLNDDLEEVGFLVFQRLLCMHEEVKKLFHIFLTQESSGEYVIDEGKLRTHARIVMEALGAAVECLDDSDQLTFILISAGQRHANYDVQSNMVQYMWPAVEGALADKLGDGLTNELKRVWGHVFDYIASKFAEGILASKKDTINTR
ncbi:hypothetical protein CHS0354_008263 [Potamilus streckersoni]|uniref:Globin domain-containing protein n=1 Tax=Potamilus streckersoni TaxID=2493646 RepID=A0AAE0T6K3_9BIVA|nr:hypothetical protein CHS0354_008263 [Potamilus streckersoni]